MGGGGKGEVKIITYTCRIRTATAICHGPIDKFYRLDYNSDFQIYDVTNNNPADTYYGISTGENILTGRLYFGNPVSTQDNILSYMHGSNTPCYRGICYCVFHLDLGASPAMPATAFTVARWPDVFADYKSNAYDISGGSYGYNPANILYDLLTNTKYGFAISTSLVDVNSFKTARNTLAGESIWYGTVIESGDLYAVIRAVLDWIDGELIFDETTGKIKLVLRREDYTVATLTEVTASDMRAGTFEMVRTSWESTKNVIYVSFFDVDRECDQNSVYAEDLGNFLTLNTIRVQEFNFDCFTNTTVAQKVCNRLLQKHSYPYAKISFECFASKGEDIKVYDPIHVVHTYYGVNGVFRVIEKRRSGQNLWKFEAIEERFCTDSLFDDTLLPEVPSYTNPGYAQFTYVSSWNYRIVETYYRGMLVLGYADDQTTNCSLNRFLVEAPEFSQTVYYSCIGRITADILSSGEITISVVPDRHYPQDSTLTKYYLIGDEIFYANDAYMSGSYLVLKSADAERGIEGTTKAAHSANARVYNIECRAMTSTSLIPGARHDLTITPWYSSPLPYYDNDHSKTTTYTYQGYILKPKPPSNLNHSGSYSGDVTFTWDRDNRVATDTTNGAPAFPVPCEGLTQYPMDNTGSSYTDQLIGWRLDFFSYSGTTCIFALLNPASPESFVSTYAQRSAAGLSTSFRMELYARGMFGYDSGPEVEYVL